MLDERGNRIDGYEIGEFRGNKPYNPSLGWNGIGLKVMDKYDKGNNEWIEMCNSKNEWCVAYHGVAKGQSSDNVKKTTGAIYKTAFKPGKGQAHKYHEDINHHPGQPVGEGVYCTSY